MRGRAPGGLRERVRSLCAGEAVMCPVQGGAVGVRIHWNCDLDAGGSDCRPHYSFQLQERSYNFRCSPHCPPAPRPGSPSSVPPWQPVPITQRSTPPGTLLCVQGGPQGQEGCSQPQVPQHRLWSSLSPDPVPPSVTLHPQPLPHAIPPLSSISLLSTQGGSFLLLP